MVKKAINYGLLSSTPSRELRSKVFPTNSNSIFRNNSIYSYDHFNNKSYIKEPEDSDNTAAKMKLFLDSPSNAMSFFIGYPGIGKTSFLRHYFNNPSSICTFKKETLTVFVSDWEDYAEDTSEYEVYRLLRRINSKIHGKYKSAQISCTLSSDLKDNSSYAELIREITYLKQLLSYSPIKAVYLILDNIDELPKDQACIKHLMTLYKELLHTTDNSGPATTCIIKMLLSSTPERFTYAVEKGDLKKHRYPFDIIYKTSSINLSRFFKNKKNELDTSVTQSEQWEDLENAFNTIHDRFGQKYDDIIKGISNYSVIEAMKAYADILTNVRWVHPRGIDTKSRSSLSDMTINNITVFRSLFCMENPMYIPAICKNRICNLFYSTETYDNSIITLLIIKLFYLECYNSQFSNQYMQTIKKAKHGTPINMYGEYWHLKKAEVITLFLQMFSDTYPDGSNMETRVSDSIDYLYHHGILAKCCKVYAGESHDISYDSRLFLTPKGKTLWEMLKNDSVLLEHFREAYVREYEKDKTDHNTICSSTLIADNEQKRLFTDLAILITDLAQEEYKLRKIASNSPDQRHTYTSYRNAFGADSIVSHLYKGLEESANFSGVRDEKFDLACKQYKKTHSDMMALFPDD